MLVTLMALFARITSNPLANAVQKILTKKYSSILINLYSYAFLGLFCLFPAAKFYSWTAYGSDFWSLVCLAGILCTLGSVCLIKALQYGELSVLGPINSYKCIVGIILGIFVLGEIPHFTELFGVLLIICGSRYTFETADGTFNPAIFLRKDIMLRFAALFFTGCEAVILKKIILMSSAVQSFILWCFSGFIFSLLLLIIFKIKPVRLPLKDTGKTLAIAVCLGIMQLSTNFVFERMNVGLALALFQLSGVIAVIFGWKIFNETNIRKKMFGVIIMIFGSCLILIK